MCTDIAWGTKCGVRPFVLNGTDYPYTDLKPDEFNIEFVQPISWNDEAFRFLVLPPGRKTLLQSLVEAHNAQTGYFDDFVPGKGEGLVINLFGPPGVGKTLSAEATSEHVRRPLYVVGAGDLGTTASDMDKQLQSCLDMATEWKAIVLIDEVCVLLRLILIEVILIACE